MTSFGANAREKPRDTQGPAKVENPLKAWRTQGGGWGRGGGMAERWRGKLRNF